MARIVLVLFFLTLVLAPVASAEHQERGDLPFAGWFDASHGAIDWLFSWWNWPSRQAVTSPTSALIVPSGIGAHLIPDGQQTDPGGYPDGIGAHLIPSGVQAEPAGIGAHLIPDG